jgi:hypothetical protein
MPDGHEIAKRHLTASTPNGQTLVAVTFTNGRCGLLIDDQPTDGMEWPAEQMSDCIATFLRLAGLKP